MGGCVQVSIGRRFFGNLSQNSPKLVLIFSASKAYRAYFVDKLLKVVSHYDLSVLFMSVMGFKKNPKVWMGMGGWDEIYPVLCVNFWNYLKPRKALN